MKTRLLTLLIAAQFVCYSSFAQENKKDAKGLKQGAWVKFDSNTKTKIYEGSFVNDKPNGLFRYYFPSGKIKAITTYSKEGSKARAILFDDKGNKIAEGVYVNEKKDSIWNYYNPDHVLISQESYLNFKKNGAWKVFYENGQLYEEINWVNGVKEGIWKQYYKDGKIKTEAVYKNGDFDGNMKFYQANGVTDLEGIYLNGMKEGPWITYLPSGEVKMREFYNKGVLLNTELVNGVFTTNYPNEILKNSYTYKEGKKNGAFTEYYNAGEWKRKIKPADGDFPEEEEEYFEGQKIQCSGTFKNDKPEGLITYYKPDGKIDRVEEYENGTLVSKKMKGSK